jgi:CDP-glycerol glycerophosphotransferase
VPVYNVEPYLATCLESLARQTFGDIEVIMVDDGSTDRSPQIADDFVARDERFRLLTQPNAGLGAARNTGIEAAQGEFIAFVDSDDYLADNAYELLVGALDQTGSDFATGNVVRMTPTGPRPVYFLEDTFAKTRLSTHVTQFQPLIADRVAWNKLWRRSFWDRHGYRFPEGVLNEDIPVTVPAHFAAKSVDVIADKIYFWRLRGGEALSITQRRLEPGALLDRLAACERVTDHLEKHGKRKWARWYEASVVYDDLRFYLNVLDSADEEYRELFLDRVNMYLDRASDKIYAELPAIERLKWHLVRRRLMPELLEVLRFQREDLRSTPPVRIGDRWYGDYPYREDERLKIPRSVYLLEGELFMDAGIDAIEREGDLLTVRGHAYINGIGAPDASTQQVSVKLLRRGPLKRLRLLFSGVPLTTEVTRRPDVTANAKQALTDLDWSGFESRLDTGKLRRAGAWDLYVTLRAGKVKRRRARFTMGYLRPLRAVDLPATGKLLGRALPTPGGGVSVERHEHWARLTGHRVDGDTLELSGQFQGSAKDARLSLLRPTTEKRVKCKLEIDGDRFTARVKLDRLRRAAADDEDAQDLPDADEGADPDVEDVDAAEEASRRVIWELALVAGGRRMPVVLDESASGVAWQDGQHALVVTRTRRLDAAVVAQKLRPLVTSARWGDDGALELAGELPAGTAYREAVLSARGFQESHSFRMRGDLANGRFEVTLQVAHVRSLAGSLPLNNGIWHLYARATDGSSPTVPLDIAPELYDQLPLQTAVRHKPFRLGQGRDERALVAAERDLDDDERGSYNQRRLRASCYVARREQPLRDAVVYSSFHGRQYSDSPRAIHEELVRRGAPLEHLWVVRDSECEAPGDATVLREGSREYLEALATARYLVYNDHFPDWFVRRPDQVCVQTWHGTPLKRLGFDVTGRRNAGNRFTRWAKQVPNWQYVVSPNRFSTPILRRAYAIEGEMMETGYPRNDILAGADRDARSRELRERLGIADGLRTVLYAPTYRDHVFDRRGRYRLELALDIERLRDALGDDTVILFRKHHYIADAVPADSNGFVRDVSAFPDGNELLLAADVLVTDYSSMMFDYANTGRPMLFFAYDLDAYGDDIRGFYVDYADTVPGPIVRTTDELAGALQDIDAVRAEHAARYEQFVAKFCELDDGHAAARVVDRVFAT